MSGCSTGSPILDAIADIFGMFTDPVNTIIKMIARAVLAAAMALFAEIMTGVPTLAVGTSKKIDGQVQWLVVYLAVGSLIFAAVRMALERTGTPGITALKGLLRMVLVAGVGTAVIGWAATVGENYADHLFSAAVFEILGSAFGCGGGIDNFLMLVLALLMLLAGILHLVLLHIRLGVMIMLMGTLPLAAAASMTEWGGTWWRKHIGWMVAWLMYKPAAALIIYSGAAMVYDGSQPGANAFGGASLRIAGFGVLALSAIALPAMLKLVVPAVAALGGDGIGAGIGGMGKMAGSLASGAKNVSGAGGGSAGRDGSGSRGSSGPSGASSPGGSGGSGSAGAPGRTGAGSPGSAGAAGAAGPAGAILGAAAQGAKIVTGVATSSVKDADGDKAWK